MQETPISDRKQLRALVREKRRNVPPDEQYKVGKAIAETALTQTAFTLGDHIALFMSDDGEVDTKFLLNALLEQGKSCYLPALEPDTTTLQFRQYLPNRPLVTNFYGLKEPDAEAPVIAAADLSTVFMPLVAFDLSGNRLGMGKGYFDRTFAFLKHDNAAGPVLIGLAHECQKVEKLEAADWDVPLAGIITGQGFYRVR